MKKQMNDCELRIYWVPTKRSSGMGECHLYPPQIINGESVWPETSLDNQCGEGWYIEE